MPLITAVTYYSLLTIAFTACVDYVSERVGGQFSHLFMEFTFFTIKNSVFSSLGSSNLTLFSDCGRYLRWLWDCIRCSACDVNCASGCDVQRGGKCDSQCKTGYALTADYRCLGKCTFLFTGHCNVCSWRGRN